MKKIIGVIIALALTLAMTVPVSAAVWMDQSYYAPGSVVTINGNNSNGAGYVPGEIVTVAVSGPNGYSQGFTTAVGYDGSWSGTVVLNSDDSAIGDYYYTAKSESGVTESGSFTDDAFSYSPASLTLSIPIGSSAYFDQTVTAPARNGDFSASYVFQGVGAKGVPAEWVTVSPDSLSFSTGTTPADKHPDTKTWRITITVPSTAAAGDYQGKVQASRINISAGGGTTFTVNVTSDTTPPVITPHVSGTLGNNGWYTSNVSVSWSITDPESSFTSTGCDSTTISNDTSGTALTCSAISAGGTNTQSVTIKRDATSPVITSGAVTGTAGTDGWYIGDVTVAFSASDSISGIAPSGNALVNLSPKTTIGEGSALYVISDSVSDMAGNTATGVVAGPFKVDKVGPVITPNISGILGNNGWYTSDVTLSWTISDAESDIASSTGAESTTIISDTIGTKLTCSATDRAGLTSSVSVTIKRDATPPTISGTATTAPNANDWYNTDVIIHWTADDVLSGLTGPVPEDSAITGEGDNLSASATVSDLAGNSTSATVNGIKIDRTPPIVTGSRSPDANEYGWNNTNITVRFTAKDDLSGIDTVTPDIILSGEGAGQSVMGMATDKAGNSAATTIEGINIDKTAPKITGTRSPGANSFGWNNEDVTVHFEATDGLSDIEELTPDTTLSGEGANQLVIGTAIDKAGNSASFTVSDINIDKTPPTISGSATTSPNANDWYNHDVTIHFTASDSLSDIDTFTSDTTLTAEAASQIVEGTAVDKAGNSASTIVDGINIDKTKPTLTFSPQSPTANSKGWNNTDVSISYTADDNLSGVAASTPDSPLSFASEGSGMTKSVTVTDKAGNSAAFTSPVVNIDKTAPIITITTPIEWASYPEGMTLNFGATDNLSDIASITATLDDITVHSGDQVLQQGVYTLKVAATDNAGNLALPVTRIFVVFDPNAGFVTGGGWINSPTGAYGADPALTGKATFGFVSKYVKGKNLPTGNTEFQFHAGSLNFSSSSYEWLVVNQNGVNAQYKGSGTINGTGNYLFMLWAGDGTGVNGADTFRIKIWDAVSKLVVYDNQNSLSETALPTMTISGGSIQIQTPPSKTR